jgi:uncharacterized protein YlxW (UPF0749 family)
VEAWKLIAIVAGVLDALAVTIAVVVAGFRIKNDESWRKTAERRKADYDDLTSKFTQLKEQHKDKCEELKDVVRERDDFTQRYLRSQAKVEYYETRYGTIPPDIHTTRG